MRSARRGLLLPTVLAGGLSLLHAVTLAGTLEARPKADPRPRAAVSRAEADAQAEPIDLLAGLRSRALKAEAEGTGDGSMVVAITNRSRKPLLVVLPPGLIAAGATGQFGGGFGGMGGMGGMGGGGMGGMVMGGGGMGGLGMGGLGGGALGGGGMGRTGGGGMGGMSMMGGTLPASSGMMSLSFIIMTLVEHGSWDIRSPMIGLMMMGGGMGGGGGMMGGMRAMGVMGGGFRSVPAAGPPQAVIRAGQSLRLLTRLVNLDAPREDSGVAMPQKGETLTLAGVDAVGDERARVALSRLVAEHAPATEAQLVMWRVADKLGWDAIARRSRDWANEHELTLARRFVARLDADPEAAGDAAALFFEVTGPDAEALSATVADQLVLGLKARAGVPDKPEGPALACRVRLVPGSQGDATVTVLATDATGSAWEPRGQFALPVARDDAGKFQPAAVADALAEGILGRLVRVQVTKAPREQVKGKLAYRMRIDNASPLLLNGLAVAGAGKKAPEGAALGMQNLGVAPRHATSLAITTEMVDRLGLKDGAHAVAADLGGL